MKRLRKNQSRRILMALRRRWIFIDTLAMLGGKMPPRADTISIYWSFEISIRPRPAAWISM